MCFFTLALLAPYLLFLREQYPVSYEEIVTAIQTVAPFFHDFYLMPQGSAGDESLLLRWTHREHETLVLDEPELGLHPAALDVLADIIKATSKRTQVVCSTQSVTFANHFEPKDFIVVDQQKGVSVFSRLEGYGMGDIWK